jgi:hypothetical protein
MANTIRIKRRANGGGAGAPTTLANAELAFNEQTNVLYYGTGTGGAGGTATSVIPIAGNGAFVDTSSAQTVGGVKTFTDTIVGSINGNAGTATKWATARDLSLTGDGTATLSSVDGSANVSAALTLATVNSNVGTYTKVTINAKGLATAGSQASLTDLSAPTADFGFGGNKLTNLADPVNAQDAATKIYVDSTAQGLDVKASVRCASTVDIATLSGLLTIDGVTVVSGDRVLVKNQTTQSQNGIYVASATAWARSSDMDAWTDFPGAFTFVEEGSTQADTGWVCTVNQGGTLGSTAITWVQFSGAGTYSAGNGLTLVGSQFSAVGTTDRIFVGAGGIDIASTYVGQTSITTLGTIGTGTWQGTTIATGYGGTGLTSFTSGGAVYATSTSALTTGTLPVASGGTGAVTLTGYVKGNGTSAFTASATIPNTDITGLGTMSTQNANNVAITGGSITNLTTFDGITIDGGTF